ncbi:hypothetical protein GH714_023358 [Hevea brasiliensis]|uniref:AB hydrolase-1 domain-containing protein n=1 Tax=Hevea brasiliensis TaxID=3981 RepID=A0A6A6LBI3_HEVBR|nr:hypothetical protein GH714_023358 [Hevea brasiliensis]
MENIQHSIVRTNGINMHIASIGTGPVILFLHGFPELWYSWRHQLLSLSSLGYRCISPDLLGYGDTDAPPSPTQYTALHVVGDLVGLLDYLGIDQVFLVAHDWAPSMACKATYFPATVVVSFVEGIELYKPPVVFLLLVAELGLTAQWTGL